MTVMVASLRDLNVAALEVAANGWHIQAKYLATTEDEVVRDVIGAVKRSGWTGRSSEQARHQIDWLDDGLEVAASTAQLVARTLQIAATRFRAIQDRLHQLLEDARKHGLIVDDAGITLPQMDHRLRHFEEYVDQRRQLVAAAGMLRQRVAELLDAAERLDTQVAAVLDKLRPYSPSNRWDTDFELRFLVDDAKAVASLAGYSESELPAQDGDPRHAAAWWAAIPAEDKTLLLRAFPQHLGGLDGLPASDRDTANRAYLEYCYGGKQSPHPDAVRQLRDLLEEADHQRPGRVLLLGFSDALDGQAIVAIGNPDHAAHTAVLVPGLGTELIDMPGQIDRANQIHNAADLMTPASGDVSVVAWLDYNAPEVNSSVLGWERSKEGGQALDGFVNGLNVAHDSSPSHVTAIGHSYGSTVVGDAARSGDGLALTDIVVAGSPGMHVDNARELNIDPRHVWAGHAEGDPVSGWAGSVPGVHDNEPTDRSFGANRYQVDTSGHSGYWQPGSVSLGNQAAIVVGRYDAVMLEHGSAPQ